ncbi:CobW family GTP-binding protein [Aquabacter spiritensis]|uniref:G3E family GTPase n=1 Tax=Aquabacter spiritensis TaxID=933073 RepID=A0A4V2UY49_9HYPH|nr:GTP-binding protein [Aquabacter spiritensis]TCT05998.1 G3E family GTPase [Aquabacter spiritensis]
MRDPAALFGSRPFGRALSRPGAGRIPVTVVTGFLGAGKTTLIRAALAHPSGARTAVIVNEFGEAGIDDVLLRTSSEQVALIGNGCICCAAKTDLHRALRNLAAERETGLVPPFDRVVVETSGVSEPGPLIQSFATDRTVATHYALEGLVTVVDAVLAARTREMAPTFTEQVVLADRILLSKTDIAAPGVVADLRLHLAALNPEAPILDAAEMRADPTALFSGRALKRAPFHCDAPTAPADSLYDTFSLEFDAPFDWPVFTRIMDTLTGLRGDDLLRVKGFVQVSGCPGPVVVHYVQHLSAPPEELTAWPEGTPRTRLVFITRGLGRARIAAVFAAVLALAGLAP